MKKLLGTVFALALLAGCGAESDQRADTISPTTEAPAETTTTTEAKTAVTQEEANAALLVVADMPTGWTQAPPEEEGDDPADSDDFCKEFQVEDVPTVVEAEASFRAGETGPFIEHSVMVFDGDEAKRAMDVVRTGLDKCQTFSTTDEDGTTFSGSFSAVSFPKVGDDTFAVRLTATAKSTGDFEMEVPMAGDIVIVRRGRAISALFHFAITHPLFGNAKLDSAISETVARKADEKLVRLA